MADSVRTIRWPRPLAAVGPRASELIVNKRCASRQKPNCFSFIKSVALSVILSTSSSFCLEAGTRKMCSGRCHQTEECERTDSITKQVTVTVPLEIKGTHTFDISCFQRRCIKGVSCSTVCYQILEYMQCRRCFLLLLLLCVGGIGLYMTRKQTIVQVNHIIDAC